MITYYDDYYSFLAYCSDVWLPSISIIFGQKGAENGEEKS